MRSGLTWVYRSFVSDLLVVGVGTVCLDPTQTAARASLERGGWPVDPALDVPGHICWRAPTADQGARSPGAR